MCSTGATIVEPGAITRDDLLNGRQYMFGLYISEPG
jgi:hypothetical protein